MSAGLPRPGREVLSLPIELIIIVIVLAAVAVSAYLFTHRDDAPKPRRVSDLTGARKCAAPLRSARTYAGLHQYRVIAPAALAKDGKCADLDFILIGWFGLLCVKCVGLGGEIYGSREEESWLQTIGERRVSFTNPLRAAEADTRLVRDILFSAGLRSVPVETVCVFTNPKATLALPRSTGHYTVKEFRALLQKEKYEQDKRVDISAVAQALEAWRVDSL